MFHSQIVILGNREVAPGYFLMELRTPEIAKNSLPGQFLHIKCSPNSNPLLRRPLSIHRVIYDPIRSPTKEKLEGSPDVTSGLTSNGASGAKGIEILYKVVGKGTYCLSKRKKGETIDCIGPLGKGFELPKSPKESDTQTLRSHRTEISEGVRYSDSSESSDRNPKSEILLIAGGIGIAPLFFLTEKLIQSEIRNPKSEIAVFMGAKTKEEILCTNELKSLGVDSHIATEDGSLGYKGLVSQLLKNQLSAINYQLSTSIYACGPKGMLKEVAMLSKEHKIPCQVCFEQFMGCGIGICNSCVIRTKQGYRRVCKDGPVFWAEEIDWEKI